MMEKQNFKLKLNRSVEIFGLKRILKILKDKEVDIGWLKKCNNVRAYNSIKNIFFGKELEKDEFDALKEWVEE